MARFATALFVLSALLCSATASPLAEEKRAAAHSGRGTYFYTGLGACGWTNVDSDKIIAVSSSIYGGGKYCGQTIQIKNTATGKTATGTVADSCPGCGPNDLDLTPSLFEELGDLDQGVLAISWDFKN